MDLSVLRPRRIPDGLARITKPQGTVLYYQPQVDSWNFSQLDWRVAISLTPAGGTATVGVVVQSTHNYQQQRSSGGWGGGGGGDAGGDAALPTSRAIAENL